MCNVIGICVTFACVEIVKYKMLEVGETGASCCNFQLKSLFVKSMLDALFLSMYILNLLFVLIECTKPMIFHVIVRQIFHVIVRQIFHVIVRQICEVSQARSTVTINSVSGANCYSTEHVGRKASVTRTCYCYYID